MYNRNNCLINEVYLTYIPDKRIAFIEDFICKAGSLVMNKILYTLYKRFVKQLNI